MYDVLYSGFDTLDVAYMGAFSDETLETLGTAKDEAETLNRDVPLTIGPGNVDVLVKPHGQKGGYRYVLTNGPTGAIFSIKHNSNAKEWNLFVSARAARLLTLGYEATKKWLEDTIAGMGFKVMDRRVNRMDYAIDVLAPDFELDVKNFVCPGRSKAKPEWSDAHILTDDGDKPRAIIAGRHFETVTVGKMPKRQVIVYDKRRAAIDLKQPYWFEVWGVDRHDPGCRVWRVEIRAGRDAWGKMLPIRTYEAAEAKFKPFLQQATAKVRYVTDADRQKNISRAPNHTLWDTVNGVIDAMETQAEPALPEPRILVIMREQRADMALKQGYGNLINKLVLDGVPPDTIAQHLPKQTARMADDYLKAMGDASVRRKAYEVGDRLKFLMGDDLP